MALLIMMLWLHPVYASQSFEQVIGEAFGLKNNDLLYREFYCGAQNKMADSVIYESDDGALIAFKTLDYNSGDTTPSFVQHNIQEQEKIAVTFDRQTLLMSVTTDNSKEDKKEYQTPGLDSVIVIDAGFDRFIQNNWDELISGKTKSFLFPLVSRFSLVSLRVKTSACRYETDSDQCFILEPSNWFFRMLAAPIELGYDSKLIRLKRYRGLSNINDENGDGLIVDIKYQYQAPGVACRNQLTEYKS